METPRCARALILALAAIFLAACVGRTPHADRQNDSTAVGLAATGTTTPTPAATQTTVPTATVQRATPTRQPVNEARATRVAEASPTPDESPTPTQPPFPAVPAPAGAAGFTWRVPDPGLLLEVVGLAAKSEEDSWKYYDYDDPVSDALSHEAAALHRAVTRDLEQHYPNGLPNADRLLAEDVREWYAWFPGEDVRAVLQAGVVQRLNNEQVVLTGRPFTLGVDTGLKPYPMELDGDAGAEWLVEVDSGTYGVRDWLPLEVDAAGRYALLPNDLRYENDMRGDETTIEVTHDLTGDGRADVVLTFYGYAWGTYFGYVEVYAWDGAALSRLDTTNFGIRSYYEEDVTLDIADHDGDGRDELQVITPQHAGFGCDWQQVSTYRWSGRQPRYTATGTARPGTPLCAIAEVLQPGSPFAPSQKAWRLENALARLKAEDVPSADYLALVRLHLAMAYASAGQDAQADRVLALLVAAEGEGGYLQRVREAYAEAEGAPMGICDALYGAAFTVEPYTSLDTDIDGLVNYSAVFGAYPYDWNPYPPLICPLPELLDNLLPTLALDSTLSPAEALAAHSLPLDWASTTNLDADQDLEWVGLLALTEPQVVVLDPVGTRWALSVAARLSGPADDFSFGVRDNDGDGRSEIIVAALLAEPVPYSAFSPCWGPETPRTSEVLLITAAEQGYALARGHTLCGTPPPLEALFAEEGNTEAMADLVKEHGEESTTGGLAEARGQAWWLTLDELDALEADPQDVYSQLNELESRVLSGETPISTHAALETMLAAVPADDPAADFFRGRLYFLLGYSYELAGDERAAVAAYVRLIHAVPTSPWSWLAAARLQRTELNVIAEVHSLSNPEGETTAARRGYSAGWLQLGQAERERAKWL